MSGFLINATDQLDNKASLGLAGTSGSDGYTIAVINNHIHSQEFIYGFTAARMDAASVAAISVTGGSGAFGTEIMLTDGTVIGGGSATKKFDLNLLIPITAGTANRVTRMQFYYGSTATPIAATIQVAGDTLTKNGHGLANGTKIMLDTIVSATAIDANTSYYVVGTAANTFQLSLTLGGAAVNITGSDGTCNYSVETQTLWSEMVMSLPAASAGANIPLQGDRIPCNSKLWARAWSVGGTNAITFFLGLHTYTA